MPDSNSVVAYLRENPGENTKEQLASIRQYVKAKGLEINSVRVEANENEETELDRIMAGIKNRKVSHLLVWDLLSLAASPARLDSIFALLHRSSSHLTIVKDQLSTSLGKELVFGVARMMLRYAVSAQKQMIKQGQSRAKKQGKQLGRPAITDKQRREARELRDKGLSYRQVGRLLKLDESTVRKNLKKTSKYP